MSWQNETRVALVAITLAAAEQMLETPVIGLTPASIAALDQIHLHRESYDLLRFVTELTEPRTIP